MPITASVRTLDSIERWCNNLHAPVADTVGRASRNNFPVIPAVAPVLFTGAVLPLVCLHANPPAKLPWLFGGISSVLLQRLFGKRQRVRP